MHWNLRQADLRTRRTRRTSQARMSKAIKLRTRRLGRSSGLARRVVAVLRLGSGAIDTHGTDTHSEIVGKLSPVLDMQIFVGVINVTDEKRLLVVVYQALGHLNLDPEASFGFYIPSLPLEDLIWIFNIFEISRGTVICTVHVELKASRVEISDVQRNWLGYGETYAASSERVDCRSDLVVSAHLGLYGKI